MKRFLAAAALVLVSNVHAFDIVAALNLGQKVALDKCEEVADAADDAAVIQASFERVKAAAGIARPITVRIARCNAMVQVLQGVVVAHPAIANWNEGERLFVLAHELGHVVNGDWHTFTSTFAGLVPAETTDAEAPMALRRAQPHVSSLMHGFEYGADSFALSVLETMGRDGVTDGCAALRKDIPVSTTPTHPGTNLRVAALMHKH